ncbi:MAG: transporter [Bacteroidales bacterium]|nr:transporter [Bacteroidales bacterium]
MKIINFLIVVWFGSLLWLITQSVGAQDLDPRAYIRLPVKTYTLITGYSYSYGAVLTDLSYPIQDLDARVHSGTIGYAQTFSLFGLSAQAMMAVPYVWSDLSGSVVGQQQCASLNGLADSRLRLTVLVLGGPAAGLAELINAPRKTIIGVSMSIGVPTGEYSSDMLINIGTHRWSFKPEMALSQPLGKRWLIDVYSGVWLFTANNSYYPGSSERSQDPLGSFQVHISYNITPRFWIAYNTTYYVGGKSTIDGITYDDRQSNTRIGLTSVLPVGKSNSIKLAASTGGIVRVGQDFTTFSIGWQHAWLGKPAKD